MRDIQKRTKVKIKELLKEYDIDYIDHNVLNDEYSIRLAKNITHVNEGIETEHHTIQ